MSSKCVIGVGSPHGDDQVGWMIADELRHRLGLAMSVHKVAAPIEILNRLENCDWLGICDGCQGIGHVGEWHNWKWPDSGIETPKFSGTHDFGLNAVLQLAAGLGLLPKTVEIWGVEVGYCQYPATVSVQVSRAATDIVDAIAARIEDNQSDIALS